MNLSKSTDHAIDFKWSIYGGGHCRELEYHYNGIIVRGIVWKPNKVIDLGSGRSMEVVGYRSFTVSCIIVHNKVNPFIFPSTHKPSLTVMGLYKRGDTIV